MKRILLLFSAIMLSCIALWAHDVVIDGIYYNLDETNKTAEVTHSGDYSFDYSGSVTIPETITYNSQTYSVTSIGSSAFYKCSGLTSVTIPNSVTSIGGRAFEDCSGLTEVTIPNSVTSIGDEAFSGTGIYNNNFNWDNGVLYIDNCLIKANSDVVKGSYTIKEGTRIIGEYAFYNCSGLTSVTIPNSVTSIGEKAFSFCGGLTSVTIGNSVTSIGKSAFDRCSRLTEVTIPNNVTSIGDEAFYGCSGLTEVTIGESVTSIGEDAFRNCSGLTEVTIPNSVTYIGGSAFSFCSGLTSVTIPNSVTSIGSWAFYNCSGLTEVTIPNSVTYIGKSAFSSTGIYNNNSNWDNGVLYIDNCLIEAKSDVVKGSYTIKKGTRVIGGKAFYTCSGLTEVTIPNSVTYIGSSAFSGCSGLTSVTIPNSVTSISSGAFSGCSGLTSVTIPNSVTSIDESAFFGCSGLTEVTIPNSVTSIGSYAFSDCSKLTSVTIPNSVTSIGSSAFSDCSKLTSVTIPNSVTSIDSWTFSNCSKLTSVTIPNSVRYIDYDAFEGCSGLTSVIWNAKNYKDFEYVNETPFFNIRSSIASFTFGNEVEHIPAYLCYKMSKLSEVTIPNSVTSIGDEAFSGCSGLTSVTIGNSVTSIGEYAFSGCSGLTKVNYLGTVDQWLKFDFKNYYDNPIYYAKNLYINGELLTDLKITSVNTIKKYAFYNCQNIKSVEIGNSVTSIGNDAFKGCSGLTSVIWNAKKFSDFSDYDDTPFYNIHSNITSFTFGNKVEHIPAYLCYGMENLKEVTIGKSVTSIGEKAFYNCSGLTKVHYLGTVDKWVEFDWDYANSNPTYYAKDLYINNELLTNIKITTADSIKNYTFYNCQSIKSVEIGNSITSIGSSAFSSCSTLTSVIWNAKKFSDFSDYDDAPFYNIRSQITSFTIGNEVEHIPAYLCYDMKNLKEVTIGKSVTSIGSYAFNYCSGLTKVNYLGTVDKWVEIDWDYADSNPTYYAKDLYINNELLTDVKITTADSIENYTFYNCQSIKSVEIGNSVTSIGSSAFYNCNGLTKVNYLGTVDKWVEIDFEDYESNPTYYAKDLYINNELLTDVKITTANSIKDYAFYNCQSIKSVEIGESVTSIGNSAFSGCSGLISVTIPNSVTTIGSSAFSSCSELTSVSIGESVTSIGSSAFSGCDKLRKVTAYPTTVPNVYKSSFAHYNAAFYVPCDVYDDYFFDDVFGTFKVTECISAEEVDAPEKVEIEVDEDNNANVIWPSTDGAKKYELEISKDGEVFCTLIFNENGQLTSIDFGNRSASVGFQFTVTGLDGASKYAYSMVAMDKKGNELQSYKGTFTTNGYVPGPGEEDEPVSITETLADANITVSGGTISVDADFSIYNTIGQDVTAFNGSLQPGVYLVSIENNIVKVMVK